MGENSTSTAPASANPVQALAAALSRLRRSPGKDAVWVENVVRTLERDRPASYERLRRRLGLAGRLADLAFLEKDERDAMVIGMLCHELIDDAAGEPDAKPARAWKEYLLRNGDWFATSFELCDDVQAPGWEELRSRAAVIAKVAVLFDVETLEHHFRPLDVIQALHDEEATADVAEVLDLLWSEDGQEMCDFHFRRHEHGYKLDASTLRESLKRLKPAAAPRQPTEETLAPQRLSGKPQAAAAQTTARREEQDSRSDPPRDSGNAAPADNFERRRRALRSGRGWGTLSDVASEAEERPDGRDLAPEACAPIVEASGHAEDMDPLPQTPEGDVAIVDIVQARAQRERQDGDLSARLQELRVQLDQIGQIAAEGRRLVDALTPELEELATQMGDLETLFERWRGVQEPRHRAA